MSIIELMIATALMGIVMATIFSALISVQRTVATTTMRMQTNDQVRLAVDQIDRQVRSGNVLYDPASETIASSGVAAGYSLRIYTQSNGVYQCVQWRVRNQVLQSRAWPVTWPTVGQATSWSPVADHIVNVTTVPFLLDSNPSYGGRLVNVDMIANASASSASNVANVEDKVSVTGRNTEYGFPQSVCSAVPAP